MTITLKHIIIAWLAWVVVTTFLILLLVGQNHLLTQQVKYIAQQELINKEDMYSSFTEINAMLQYPPLLKYVQNESNCMDTFCDSYDVEIPINTKVPGK